MSIIEIEEKELIVIGKIDDNCYKFTYNNESNTSTSIVSAIIDPTEELNIQYIKLVIEILTFFKDQKIYDVIKIHIPHLFVAECLENWIEKWKDNDFYIDNEKTKERPNRSLLLQVSNLKNNCKFKIQIIFNFRLL